ncbi:MAG: hypothetical protein M1832_002400 [Thelocarpon impressellum]|nr:MAG: hypothetical protein M1832_002400 [Thelocarpon impressellum]
MDATRFHRPSPSPRRVQALKDEHVGLRTEKAFPERHRRSSAEPIKCGLEKGGACPSSMDPENVRRADAEVRFQDLTQIPEAIHERHLSRPVSPNILALEEGEACFPERLAEARFKPLGHDPEEGDDETTDWVELPPPTPQEMLESEWDLERMVAHQHRRVSLLRFEVFPPVTEEDRCQEHHPLKEPLASDPSADSGEGTCDDSMEIAHYSDDKSREQQPERFCHPKNPKECLQVALVLHGPASWGNIAEIMNAEFPGLRLHADGFDADVMRARLMRTMAPDWTSH